MVLTSHNAPDSISGFNQQSYNWQGSLSFQHELRPGLGINIGYFRTWYGNFLATDNLAVTPADYSEDRFTAPTDDRLGSTSGERICGLYDLNPDKFGQVDNLDYAAISLRGSQRDLQRRRYQPDRPLPAGRTGGRRHEHRSNHDGELRRHRYAVNRFCKVTPPWSSGTQVKFLVVYPLPWDLQTSVIYQNFSGIPTGSGHRADQRGHRAVTGPKPVGLRPRRCRLQPDPHGTPDPTAVPV